MNGTNERYNNWTIKDFHNFAEKVKNNDRNNYLFCFAFDDKLSFNYLFEEISNECHTHVLKKSGQQMMFSIQIFKGYEKFFIEIDFVWLGVTLNVESS